jgi:hypothetical protein
MFYSNVLKVIMFAMNSRDHSKYSLYMLQKNPGWQNKFMAIKKSPSGPGVVADACCLSTQETKVGGL